MGQHRTRKEKERAEIARLKHPSESEALPANGPSYTFSSSDTRKPVSGGADNLLKIDQKYIIKDLWKTVIISSILLVIVIGIYFYLRYN